MAVEQSVIEEVLSSDANRLRLDHIQETLRPNTDTDVLDTRLPLEFVSALLDYPTRRNLLAERKEQLSALLDAMPHVRSQVERLQQAIEQLDTEDRRLVKQAITKFGHGPTTVSKIAQALGGQPKLSVIKGMNLGELASFVEGTGTNGVIDSPIATSVAMKIGVVYRLFGDVRRR